MRWLDVRLVLSLALAACATRTGTTSDTPPAGAAGPTNAAEAPAVTVEPKDPEPSEAERGAVEAACKQLGGSRRPVRCEGGHYLGDFIVVRAIWKTAAGHGATWHVSKRDGNEHRLLRTTSDLSGGEQLVEPDVVCDTDAAADGTLPAGAGLVGAELRDLNLDGRADLLLECRFETSSAGQTEGRYLRYCLADAQACEEPIWRRRARDGRVEMDVDVEFIDGWFVRTVRVFEDSGDKGNLQVPGVRTPDPRPPRRP